MTFDEYIRVNISERVDGTELLCTSSIKTAVSL